LSDRPGAAPQVAAMLAEGRRLLDAGMAADAIDLLGRAGAAAPRDTDCARWLAEAQLVADAVDDARRTLDEALAHAPGRTELIVLRAEAALARRDIAEAEAVLDPAIAAAPDDAALLAERARVRLMAGRIGAALEDVELSLALDPADLAAASLGIVLAAYDPAVTTARLKALQRGWPSPPAEAPAFATASRAGRPLRVGYVCCGLYRHAAADVAAAVLLNHDPAKVEVYCYAGSRRRDAVSLQFRLAARGWRTIVGLGDAAAAAQIRADRIDILVDLDGHFPHNRLGVFARRAAPMQVSAWGYPPGPGIDAIDYLMTDAVVAPASETELFAERLVRLPCAQPYAPQLRSRPAPSAPPAERAPGPIRFGCFNRLDKLTADTLSLWGEVLRAAPGATLTLKDRFFSDRTIETRIATALVEAGADPAQLRFEPGESHGAYLAAFDRIDVGLDPLPVSGGVTTLDGLSQGVPAIALAGAAPTGRITASILAYAGLADGVCATREAYARTAVALAGDAARLANLQGRTLAARARFADNAMRGYTAEVEGAYVEMWDRYAADGHSGRRPA
jgi:predicted O-linked N-acetylglucosamine transferase (SPINDLY family)